MSGRKGRKSSGPGHNFPMNTPDGSFPGGPSSGYSGSIPVNPSEPILSPMPLRMMPYASPPLSVNGSASSSSKEKNNTPPVINPNKRKNASPVRSGPAMIFLPSNSNDRKWQNVLDATENGVALSGVAALGKVGPTVGLVDIGESNDMYLFRVSLPGVKRDAGDLSCVVKSDGTVLIKGVTTTGERRVCRNNVIFEMQSHNLCSPGEFSVTFQLPGSVDPSQLTLSYKIAGILEGVVKRKQSSCP